MNLHYEAKMILSANRPTLNGEEIVYLSKIMDFQACDDEGNLKPNQMSWHLSRFIRVILILDDGDKNLQERVTHKDHAFIVLSNANFYDLIATFLKRSYYDLIGSLCFSLYGLDKSFGEKSTEERRDEFATGIIPIIL